jgi:hypothetical protein
VLTEYSDVFAEPYPGCWQDYGTLLQTVAEQGVAAGPDNARLYSDATGGHILLSLDFYDAVAGRNWCWFYFNALDLLNYYTDYNYWPPLPDLIPQTHPVNSEIFGLGLMPQTTTLPGGTNTVVRLNTLRTERGLSETVISNEVADVASTWYIYNPAIWSAWTAFSMAGDDPFPAIAPVKAQYDYAGADAAIRIEAQAGRMTPGASSSLITWTAAAKPFGYLASDGVNLRPDACSLVLPAFHNVRLIPVDTSSAPAGGAYDINWRRHIEYHLPQYLANGLAGVDANCRYCQQLVTWEDPSFRAEGRAWLAVPGENGLANRCLVEVEEGPGPGGGGGGGGTTPTGNSSRRRGH